MHYVFRPGGGFHPAGGFEFNSKSIVFEPFLTVYFNPDVSLFPYQAGVSGFPGRGGPPSAVFVVCEGAVAVTAIW
jgi:hypothetical protein